jgi:hypothetical protein
MESTEPAVNSSELLSGASEDAAGFTKCAACGMLTYSARDFHPYAACVMFRQTSSSEKVEANLRHVVEYGMKAQASGVDLETAMCDITKVREAR